MKQAFADRTEAGVGPLVRTDDGAVATLTLSRPDRRNALSEETIAALRGALNALAANPDIRAVVIAGQGPAFSAGHDLKEMTARRGDGDRGRAYFTRIMTRCSEVMQAITALPQPVIAAVDGIATAAGCQLVASCDLVVAGTGARFQTPGVNIGLFCSTPMVALTRAVAPRHAMEMLLLGDAIDAEEAHRFGLVNRIVPAGTAVPAAQALAARIAARSGRAVKLGKRAFYEQAEMTVADAYRRCSDVMVENMLAQDAVEGIGAYLDKRAPKWNHR